MTDAGLAPDHLAWVLQTLGARRAVRVTPLHSGGTPWRIEVETEAGPGTAVLRVGGPSQAGEIALLETMTPALLAADVPVAAVLGSRVDGSTSLLLLEWVDGSSAMPREPDPARLEAFGALAARISRTDVSGAGAGFELPTITRLWQGRELAAVIDWDCAGIGQAGVDLASLRLDAATAYGVDAAEHVLAGWEREAGREAADVAYWDAVAAVNTPPDLAWFVETTVEAVSRPDLTRAVMVARRDEFLESALGRPG